MDHQPARVALDSAAVGTGLGSYMHLFPEALNAVAALLSVVWLSIQIGSWMVRRFREWRK